MAVFVDYEGIVKHIGDILREYFPKARNNIIAIGIAPWGVISERNLLIGSEVNRRGSLIIPGHLELQF